LGKGIIDLADREAHYIRDVLRMRRGEAITVFDGTGQEASAQIVEVARDSVRLHVEAPRTVLRSGLEVTLVVGLSKGDKIDLVIEKATELGVRSILPATTSRAVVQLGEEKARARVSRWQRVAEAAARQSGRADVPEVGPVRSLAEQLALARADAALFFYEGGTAGTARAALARPPPRTAAVAVGPEGGFAGEEVDLARTHGYEVVSLGPRILRSETAAIAAVTLVQHAWGDLA
jgi:16S rRNA (uracil1498-N3)-methyltransferase